MRLIMDGGEPTMKLTIRARHIDLPSELRDQIHRRLHFALGRFASEFHSVDLSISDLNGPKGGADKQCRIQIRGRAVGTVVIEHVGSEILPVVSLAADRAERAVVRGLARGRRFGPALIA